jgi:hypothetical protein
MTAPDRTDRGDADPGITILELLAYLAALLWLITLAWRHRRFVSLSRETPGVERDR